VERTANSTELTKLEEETDVLTERLGVTRTTTTQTLSRQWDNVTASLCKMFLVST